MLANPAVPARPGILTQRAGAPTIAAPTAEASPFAVRPRMPWARHHLAFRGTRIFSALMLSWAGLILIGFGAFAVPAANELGRAEADPGLMSLLGTVAPLIWGLGIIHLVGAVGLARDRLTWGIRLVTWLLAAGGLVVAAGLVLVLAGRDPVALVHLGTPAGNGIGLLAWTLGLYALVGWGVRRVVTARQLSAA